jgi:hypothetical protein
MSKGQAKKLLKENGWKVVGCPCNSKFSKNGATIKLTASQFTKTENELSFTKPLTELVNFV